MFEVVYLYDNLDKMNWKIVIFIFAFLLVVIYNFIENGPSVKNYFGLVSVLLFIAFYFNLTYGEINKKYFESEEKIVEGRVSELNILEERERGKEIIKIGNVKFILLMSGPKNGYNQFCREGGVFSEKGEMFKINYVYDLEQKINVIKRIEKWVDIK